MNDDFNTAKVLANLFEIVPTINGIKDGHIAIKAISSNTLASLKLQCKLFIEDVFGLQNTQVGGEKLDGIIQLLINLRKEAKAKKDFVTSDKIRNELTILGVNIKDEKNGEMSYSLS